MSLTWPFANSLWCPWHPGLQYQERPETVLQAMVLTDDPGTFSHSVEDGIIVQQDTFLFLTSLFSCSCTFHDYDSSILISGICYLLMISTLYQHSNLVSDNCKLRFPLILYTSLLRSPLTAVNMAFKSVKITVLSSSPIVGELTLST